MSALTAQGYVSTPVTVAGGSGFTLSVPTKETSSYSEEDLATLRAMGYDEKTLQQLQAFNDSTSSIQSIASQPFSIGMSGNHFVMATKADYLNTLATPATAGLGQSGEYGSAFGDVGSRLFGGQLFVNLGSLMQLAYDNGGADDLSAEKKAWTDRLRAAGIQSWNENNHSYLEVRVSFK